MRTRLVPVVLGLTIALTVSPISAKQTQVPSTIYRASDTSSRVVALTFDDGPSPFTPQIVSILAHNGVKATFFVVGEHVQQYPQYVRLEARQGNLIGDHTFTHPDLETLTPAQIAEELAATKSAIWSAAHYRPHWFRPPYGSVDPQIASIAASLGLRTILWSVDPTDWSLPGTQAIIDRVVGAVVPGSVVLMHDGGGDRSETVAALPVIISALRSEGYRFETLDQLFDLACPPHAGRLFSADHVPARHTAIYRTWLRLLCGGTNLGPATSGQYRKQGLMVQDFYATAHQIQFRSANQSSKVVVNWGAAARAFAGRGVQPSWGQPITHAWMALFVGDRDRGPALDKERRHGHVIEQRFLWATAVQQAHGVVTWRFQKAHRRK